MRFSIISFPQRTTLESAFRPGTMQKEPEPSRPACGYKRVIAMLSHLSPLNPAPLCVPLRVSEWVRRVR